MVEPVLSGGGRRHGHDLTPEMSERAQRAPLPCRTLTALVSPPAYTQMRSFEVPWGINGEGCLRFPVGGCMPTIGSDGSASASDFRG